MTQYDPHTTTHNPLCPPYNPHDPHMTPKWSSVNPNDPPLTHYDYSKCSFQAQFGWLSEGTIIIWSFKSMPAVVIWGEHYYLVLQEYASCEPLLSSGWIIPSSHHLLLELITTNISLPFQSGLHKTWDPGSQPLLYFGSQFIAGLQAQLSF